jgi:hypothetical protein
VTFPADSLQDALTGAADVGPAKDAALAPPPQVGISSGQWQSRAGEIMLG